MTTSKWRGNTIYCKNDKWHYQKDNKLVSEDSRRKCGHCGESETKEGHDGCIGKIPDVMNACCGHGSIGEAYIQYNNGAVIRGEYAINIMKNN